MFLFLELVKLLQDVNNDTSFMVMFMFVRFREKAVHVALLFMTRLYGTTAENSIKQTNQP